MYETTCPQCHMANASNHNYCGRCGAALDDAPIVVSESKGLSVGGMNLPARQLRQIGFSVLVSAATLLAEVGVIYLNRRVQQIRQDSAVVPLQRTNPTNELLPSAEEPRSRKVTVISERIVEVRRFGRPVQRLIERVAWRSED